MDGDPDSIRDDAEFANEVETGDEMSAVPAPDGDAAEQLRSLVLYLARNLVDDPENVQVDVQPRGGSVFLTLRVPEAELGKVIGRQGRIARALRTALMIAGSRQHVRASLDIEG